MEEILEILKKMKPNVDFNSVTNIIDEGILDSLDIVNLIGFLSEKFEIEIGPEYIDPDNFVSVKSIWNMVQQIKK